jgi:alpha/beta superfamily hydrolase
MTNPTPQLAGTGQAIRIPGPAGWIEAALDPAKAPTRAAICIVCHPLPTEGGTMHNKVVTTVARALRESGVTTLRFNFRGVGQSDGTFDDGEGELDDLRAVAHWAREQHPGLALWLAGFSFGAWVSLRGAQELDAAALVSIAPPVGRSWAFAGLLPPPIPWLVVQGEADEIVAPRAVFDWLATLPRPPQQVRMPETSHFFHRKLIDLRDAVKQAVRDWPPLPHD